MSWQAQDLDNDGIVNDVVLTVKSAWRRDFVGDIALTFAPAGPTGTELSNSIVFVGGDETASDSDYAFQTTVYEVLNLVTGTEYLVSYDSGNTTAELENNSRGLWSIQTIIQLSDDNQAPGIEFPVIYEVPQKNSNGSTLTNWTFDVDALDQNADSVRYRMANNAELGGGSSVNADGLSIDATSGLITWSGSGTRTVGLYSGGIIAEDFDSTGAILSKTHVDFLLDLRNASKLELTPPSQVSDSRNEIVEKGHQFSFSFDDPGLDVVALGNIQGALVETSPNSFTFTSGDIGSSLDPGVYSITFEINDPASTSTNNYYSINFIIPDPDAPAINNLQDDRTPYFTLGTAVIIDKNQDASITDTNNVNFNGGKLKLNLSNSDYTNETLSINSVGTGPGEISVSGSSVFYEGVLIGTIDTDLNGVNKILAIDFTSTDATLDAVAALVKQLNYTNSVEAADRDLTLSLQDSDGLSNFYSFYLQAVSPDNSKITATLETVAADGTSETTITVALFDSSSRAFDSTGGTVVISSDIGTVSAVTDNADGTYSATLTRTDTGAVAVTASINDAPVTDTASVTFSSGTANATTSVISVSDSSPSTDDTVIVTVQAIDAAGNILITGGNAFVVTSNEGSISVTTDNGDGTYTASLSNSTTGSVIVGTALDDVPVNNTKLITFSPGAASAENSKLTISNSTPTTDESVTVTLQTFDSASNAVGSGGDTVIISSTLGTISTTVDNGDGTYSATLTSTTTGTASVSYTLNSNNEGQPESVTFALGAADPATSVLSVANNEVTTLESTVVTLQAKDQHGNDLTEGGLQISFVTTLGTFTSFVIDNADGSYSASFSSSTSGTASISAQVEGVTVDSTVSIQVSASMADPIQSRVTSSSELLVANGTNTCTITVQMVDASGNLLNSEDDLVTLDTDRGLLSDIVNNGYGTYTATYTAPDKLGQPDAVATLTSTINGEPGNSKSIALTLNPAGDEDKDGVSNSVEGTSVDSDNDGTPDYLDEDDDNDGINTLNEGSVDTDDDGTPDYLDTDSDNDGIPDIIEADCNTDGDAVPNYPDTDSDNDNDVIPDSIENPLPVLSGIDSDADGIDDTLDVDATEGVDFNENGIDDHCDVSDSDGDNIPDYLDTDSDNDGIPDSLEGFADTDEDGIADYRDEDSNNDGISDRVAANISGIDTDLDGISDEFDVDNTGGADENGDGVDDAATLSDLDDDGIPDVQDSDIDGDGVTNTEDRFPQDSREASDADNDGLGDNEDDDDDNDGYTDEVETANGTSSTDSESLPSAVDTDGDLIADSVERGNDSDGDGIEDYLEVDSDNDGIFDHIEASADTVQARLNDIDNDGRVDAGSSGAGAELLYVVVDTDGDGVDDYRDLDSDNDGISDATEAAPRQRATQLNDVSSGFLDDDSSSTGIPGYHDVDEDAIENFRDLDSDNDNISDLVEGGGSDADGDGRQDDFVDTNGDGFSDTLTPEQLALNDTDRDGLPDFIDLDSDQDGLVDLLETAGTDDNRDGRVDGFIDLNGDGWTDVLADSRAFLIDTDNDGTPNYRDLDSDNDGIFDLVESGQLDKDNDGVVDVLDSDKDGIPDGVDIDVTGGVDADNDGIDDQFDPSFSDLPDTDNDGIIDQFDTDANGDGLDDSNTFSESGLGAELPDSDNDGIADVLDQSEDSVHIGLSGSGCSIASSSGSDPFFWIMVVLAGVYFYVSKRCRKANRTIRSVLPVLIGVLLSGSIQADEQRGLYLGAGVAVTSLKPEVEGTSFTVDDSSSAGWHALIGYRFHRRWQAELGYADLGEASLAPAATLAYSELNVSVLYDVWKGGVFGGRENLALFGRLGAGKLSGESGLNVVEDSSVQALFGLGIDAKLTRRFTLRTELVSYDKDARRLGVALLYRFGSQEHDSTPALAEMPVLERDTTLSQYSTAVQAPVYRESEIAAALARQSELIRTPKLVSFDFNSDSLTTIEQDMLQNLALDVKSIPLHLMVSGHTDSSGPNSYNDQLSTVRAQSVRNYLILQGVDPDVVKAIGHGESDPVANNALPEGRARNRRVEIKVYREVAR